MFIGDLTKYELERFKAFKKHHRCPICNEVIDVCDGFEMMKVKYASNTYYAFFHTKCILSQLSKRFDDKNKQSKWTCMKLDEQE